MWTQEGDTIVVWFIAKHKVRAAAFHSASPVADVILLTHIFLSFSKSVSRLAKLIDDAKNRTARQSLPQAFVSELDSDQTLQTTVQRSEVMLDALGNVPLKLYDVNFDSIDDITKASWSPQMHLTEEERTVVEAKGTSE